MWRFGTGAPQPCQGLNAAPLLHQGSAFSGQQPVHTGELLTGTCVARAAPVLRHPRAQQPRGAPSSLQVCDTPLPL